MMPNEILLIIGTVFLVILVQKVLYRENIK